MTNIVDQYVMVFSKCYNCEQRSAHNHCLNLDPKSQKRVNENHDGHHMSFFLVPANEIH